MKASTTMLILRRLLKWPMVLATMDRSHALFPSTLQARPSPLTSHTKGCQQGGVLLPGKPSSRRNSNGFWSSRWPHHWQEILTSHLRLLPRSPEGFFDIHHLKNQASPYLIFFACICSSRWRRFVLFMYMHRAFHGEEGVQFMTKSISTWMNGYGCLYRSFCFI